MHKTIIPLCLAGTLTATGAWAQDDTIQIGVPVFLSGPAAGAFGQPERNAAELLLDSINEGSVPAPYDSEGINGRTIEATFSDEASDAVVEYRNLVERNGAEVVIGYTSSANCKSVAPLAEDLQTLTVFVDCGSRRRPR